VVLVGGSEAGVRPAAVSRRGQRRVRRTGEEVAVVDPSIAWIDCSVQAEVLVGDHFMVIGTVGGMEAADGEPLLFQAGQFGTYTSLSPEPSLASTGA
jgi:flavin reductase (DIM6/NTAB) family NADH-FMN oxidoreductase RutF